MGHPVESHVRFERPEKHRDHMLNENDVIDAVSQHLQKRGYCITQRLATSQRGVDLIAVKQGDSPLELRIEAKGATSSRGSSARYGKPFNGAQVRDHVANAFYCAATMLEPKPLRGKLHIAIALPDTRLHRRCAAEVREALRTLGIGMFWVGPDRQVHVESSWQI